MVKNLPAMQETWVQSLGQEDLLEEETATHCSTLAWKIPWTEEPGSQQSVNYKLALAKGIRQLPLRRPNSVLWQLLTFSIPEGAQGGE